MADAENKSVEDDRISEMEDEVPICCFAFDLICCPQKYWNITTKPVPDDGSGDKKEDGEEDKKEDK